MMKVQVLSVLLWFSVQVFCSVETSQLRLKASRFRGPMQRAEEEQERKRQSQSEGMQSHQTQLMRSYDRDRRECNLDALRYILKPQEGEKEWENLNPQKFEAYIDQVFARIKSDEELYELTDRIQENFSKEDQASIIPLDIFEKLPENLKRSFQSRFISQLPRVNKEHSFRSNELCELIAQPEASERPQSQSENPFMGQLSYRLVVELKILNIYYPYFPEDFKKEPEIALKYVESLWFLLGEESKDQLNNSLKNQTKLEPSKELADFIEKVQFPIKYSIQLKGLHIIFHKKQIENLKAGKGRAIFSGVDQFSEEDRNLFRAAYVRLNIKYLYNWKQSADRGHFKLTNYLSSQLTALTDDISSPTDLNSETQTETDLVPVADAEKEKLKEFLDEVKIEKICQDKDVMRAIISELPYMQRYLSEALKFDVHYFSTLNPESLFYIEDELRRQKIQETQVDKRPNTSFLQKSLLLQTDDRSYRSWVGKLIELNPSVLRHLSKEMIGEFHDLLMLEFMYLTLDHSESKYQEALAKLDSNLEIQYFDRVLELGEIQSQKRTNSLYKQLTNQDVKGLIQEYLV